MMNKTKAAYTLYKPLATCLPADALEILVLVVAMHMHDHPRHRVKGFMHRVQSRLAYLEERGVSKAETPSVILDPAVVRAMVILSGSFWLAGLVVFGIIWAGSTANFPVTYWTQVTVFMAAYGLFVFITSTSRLVMTIMKW